MFNLGIGFKLTERVGSVGGIGPNPLLPSNTTAPTLSGTTQSGSALSCSTGVWTNSPTSYAYQWQSNGANVGTNSNSYTLTTGDIGNTVRCFVTATNATGSGSAVSNTVGPITSGGGAFVNSLDFSDARNSAYIAAIGA